MKYERLSSIPFPHGAEPRLDDTLRFLEIATMAGIADPKTVHEAPGVIAKAQVVHTSLHQEADYPNTKFAAVRNQDDEIVGAASYTILPEFEYLQLEMLAVDPEYRGQRIGAHLLDLIIDHGIDSGATRAVVIPNQEAHEFYLKQGFGDVDNDRSEIRVMSMEIEPHSQ